MELSASVARSSAFLLSTPFSPKELKGIVLARTTIASAVGLAAIAYLHGNLRQQEFAQNQQNAQAKYSLQLQELLSMNEDNKQAALESLISERFEVGSCPKSKVPHFALAGAALPTAILVLYQSGDKIISALTGAKAKALYSAGKRHPYVLTALFVSTIVVGGAAFYRKVSQRPTTVDQHTDNKTQNIFVRTFHSVLKYLRIGASSKADQTPVLNSEQIDGNSTVLNVNFDA